MSGSKREVYQVESYDEELDGWVLETSRTSEAAARDDVEDLRTVGKKARIVGDQCICKPAGFGTGQWCPKCKVMDNH